MASWGQGFEKIFIFFAKKGASQNRTNVRIWLQN
jgi:hypothetical protein